MLFLRTLCALRRSLLGLTPLLVAGLLQPAHAATRVRVVSANLASGRRVRYQEAGARILESLGGDIYLLQRARIGDDDEKSVRELVRRVLGGRGYFYREPEDALGAIPNAIISRYPILESGQWRDVEVADRDFAWALIDVPGRRHMLVVSVNFKAGDKRADRRRRKREAAALVRLLRISRAARHWLVIGGSLHNRNRDEDCLYVLDDVVVTSGPWPQDDKGRDGTTGDRKQAQDWVLADEDLDKREAAVLLEDMRYPGGLVFDSRVFGPITRVPALRKDSRAPNMDHMPVVRDFMMGGGPNR